MSDDEISTEALADAVKHTHGCDARFVERVDITPRGSVIRTHKKTEVAFVKNEGDL